MFLRIFVIDTIYLGCLDYTITLELESPEYRRRISRRIWITCTTNTDNDPPLLDMTECSASDEVLSNSMSRHCRHHTYIDSSCLDCLTYSESVDDRCHHPHLIADHSIESALLELYPSEYIPPTDDYRDLELTHLYEIYDLLGYIGKEFWIDTVSLLSLEGFTGELEEDSLGVVILFHA